MLVQSASVAVCTEVEALMFDVRAPVDIKELKLLAEFSHPNIVRFVCSPLSFCLVRAN